MASVSEQESNVRVAVCAESVSQSTSLEGGDPRPQLFETDNRYQLQERTPVTST